MWKAVYAVFLHLFSLGRSEWVGIRTRVNSYPGTAKSPDICQPSCPVVPCKDVEPDPFLGAPYGARYRYRYTRNWAFGSSSESTTDSSFLTQLTMILRHFFTNMYWKKSFWSEFTDSGSRSSIFGWIPIWIRIRIQSGSRVLMTKIRKKNNGWKNI